MGSSRIHRPSAWCANSRGTTAPTGRPLPERRPVGGGLRPGPRHRGHGRTEGIASNHREPTGDCRRPGGGTPWRGKPTVFVVVRRQKQLSLISRQRRPKKRGTGDRIVDDRWCGGEPERRVFSHDPGIESLLATRDFPDSTISRRQVGYPTIVLPQGATGGWRRGPGIEDDRAGEPPLPAVSSNHSWISDDRLIPD